MSILSLLCRSISHSSLYRLMRRSYVMTAQSYSCSHIPLLYMRDPSRSEFHSRELIWHTLLQHFHGIPTLGPVHELREAHVLVYGIRCAAMASRHLTFQVAPKAVDSLSTTLDYQLLAIRLDELHGLHEFRLHSFAFDFLQLMNNRCVLYTRNGFLIGSCTICVENEGTPCKVLLREWPPYIECDRTRSRCPRLRLANGHPDEPERSRIPSLDQAHVCHPGYWVLSVTWMILCDRTLICFHVHEVTAEIP